jgi:hypothetical protein
LGESFCRVVIEKSRLQEELAASRQREADIR